MVMTHDNRTALTAQGVTKCFGVTKALDNASIEILAGEVHAIVGENGAGKSTLMKILSGVYQEYEGTLCFQGRPVTLPNTFMAQQTGICMIHQELNLIPYLSISENIFLGREFLTPFGLIDVKRMRIEASQLLDKLDLHIDPDRPVCQLRVGQQQLIEIAKALAFDAQVIIMDEPTSAISDHEVDMLFELIRALTEQGVAIVYITHKMEEVFQIAQRITVMRDGRMIGTHLARDIKENEIVAMMVGRDLKDFFVKAEAVQETAVLQVRDICLNHPTRPDDYLVDHVSLSCRRGEVLGLFGLMGAGRTELLETLFGVHPKSASGQVWVEGREVPIDLPQDAIEAGIALVPEDRKRQGLVLEMSVRDSISLASLNQVESCGFLNPRLEGNLARDYIERLQIKTPNAHQKVKNLSGGNQQKVVIAKWLATHPMVLLLDDPTRGIDINAKNEIYKLISELALTGMAIVMVSSELPEIMRIADRIIVLAEGRQTGEFLRGQATEESLLKAALPRQQSSHKNADPISLLKGNTD
ncbi:MAG: sugar ABC transporter ATP-binding protein [Phycisphaerae bacterium]|nr:sugar ABC transporter ATP-binding protein [Phycisphaerae bacterium]